jgi:hypothetical protein
VTISATNVVSLEASFITEALKSYEEFAAAFDQVCPTTLWRSVFDFEDAEPSGTGK